MEKTWSCSLKSPPKPITVGDKLVLLCSGDFKPDFQKNLFIETDDYSLVLLKVLRQEDHFLELLASSYRTGWFKKSFKITDGEHFVRVDDLSFEVQSLLSPQDKKPAEAFGPFKPPMDLLFLFPLLCFLSFVFLFVYRFFKRKRFISAVAKRRQSLNPIKAFFLNLRKEPADSPKKIKHLESCFRVFLEDFFLVPALRKKDQAVIKQLKKYHSKLDEKKLRGIQIVFNEFSKRDKDSYIQLKKLCKKLIFSLEEEKAWKI